MRPVRCCGRHCYYYPVSPGCVCVCDGVRPPCSCVCAVVGICVSVSTERSSSTRAVAGTERALNACTQLADCRGYPWPVDISSDAGTEQEQGALLARADLMTLVSWTQPGSLPRHACLVLVFSRAPPSHGNRGAVFGPALFPFQLVVAEALREGGRGSQHKKHRFLFPPSATLRFRAHFSGGLACP